MKNLKNKKGFTLVELLIAMAIFVLFISVLINAYSYIVRAQREANDERVLYVEARKVFDTLILEFRDGMVDYLENYNTACGDSINSTLTNKQDEIHLVSKDDQVKTTVYLENGIVKMVKESRDAVSGSYGLTSESSINSEAVIVQALEFRIAPSLDPYDLCTVLYDQNQFHPMVNIYAEFAREGQEEFPLILQTSIASRVYNQIYAP